MVTENFFPKRWSMQNSRKRRNSKVHTPPMPSTRQERTLLISDCTQSGTACATHPHLIWCIIPISNSYPRQSPSLGVLTRFGQMRPEISSSIFIVIRSPPAGGKEKSARIDSETLPSMLIKFCMPGCFDVLARSQQNPSSMVSFSRSINFSDWLGRPSRISHLVKLVNDDPPLDNIQVGLLQGHQVGPGFPLLQHIQKKKRCCLVPECSH